MTATTARRIARPALMFAAAAVALVGLTAVTHGRPDAARRAQPPVVNVLADSGTSGTSGTDARRAQ